MTNRADLHTLTGAYATDSLDDAERAQFEEHIGQCPACAQEVRELSATAARLGLAAAVVPRPALKEQVLRSIATVRQEAPRTEPGPPGGTVPRAPLRRASRWALAACLAAATAFGATAVWQHREAGDARDQAREVQQRTEELASLLAAPDARTRTAKLAGGARATVVVSEGRDRAAFLATGMAEPPRGKVYQLWFNDKGTMRSAGLMDPERTTSALVMKGRVGEATGMGVTVEPAGGSPEPTTKPVALLDFPA
ncbi:anti-sigma factor [Streptomyces silvensis]|uniref:Regulator of SigK n=1 Tax=Streptomyces silvensis TaxID=1765722 RepID=A0A0W7X5H6_9ACTN|nr:anti-sigma factor [Streptomyces silvensis]KUF18109.1 anti-sigma factor [Streptomyces silvensis]